jgi:hypothetical protein
MLAAAGQNHEDDVGFRPMPTVGDVAEAGEYTKFCAFVYPAVAAAESVIPRLGIVKSVLAVGFADELMMPELLMQKLFTE